MVDVEFTDTMLESLIEESFGKEFKLKEKKIIHEKNLDTGEYCGIIVKDGSKIVIQEEFCGKATQYSKLYEQLTGEKPRIYFYQQQSLGTFFDE